MAIFFWTHGRKELIEVICNQFPDACEECINKFVCYTRSKVAVVRQPNDWERVLFPKADIHKESRL